MKHLFLTTLLTLVFAASGFAAQSQKHLFILSGQSNMVHLDPSISFQPRLEAEFGKGNVTVVKDARGAQPIRRWYKDWKPSEGDAPNSNGDLYTQLMKKVDAAIKDKQFDTVTFLWMQGERDARKAHGDVYADSLKGLYAQLCEDLKRKDINFIIGRLSDFDMSNKKYPHWTKVREAQVKVAESNPRFAWVNTDDLNDGVNAKGRQIKNDLHYTVAGYKEFGNRLAETAIRLIKE